MSNTDTIAKARTHLSAHRTITRNLRLKRYEGRNSTSTELTLQYHYQTALDLLSGLSKEIQGDIWAEHQLAARLSQARDEGQIRPELKRRLLGHRKAIRAVLA